MPQIQDRTSGDLLENASGSSVKSTTVRFLEFSVFSQEGINLVVDISSSSLDSPKRYENEVCLCQAFQENKFQSFRQELEYLQKNCKQIKSSLTWSTTSKTTSGSDHVKIDSSPNSLKRENEHLVINCPDGENGSLEMSQMKDCKVVREVSDAVEKQENPTLCELDLVVVSDTTSSTSCEVIEPSCAPQAKSTCSFVESLAADGSENATDCQSTRLWNKTYKNADIQSHWSEANHENLFDASSAINTPDVQSSEDAGLQKDAACSPFIYEPLLNPLYNVESTKMEGEVLENSLEIDQNGHFKSSSVVGEAWSCSVNDIEASSKSGNKAEMSISDGGYKRKRQCYQSDKVFGICGGKILRRSTRRHSSKGLPRRSKRLFPKRLSD
ncbi:uncharacterized protein LOC113764514 [Coffea eugenioides]|uniref:Uncharacterized protein LOC113736620 n=1 Tax=Coffea arabica TaxID=13443 RepID=A0A6P6WVR7_COFAR|nr:uncharacterized protein LOC113736620 [Coffea arabica]XP_027119480.1 uncharacterized protein LOC113736620 [Coffea arabica]XP_027164231.1 uncharacterized protein LOC113764514 [Coffea eugenioides]XP_027164232.1 uncharacterized protein LOC113764514 [Coffea eugenioides]